MESKGFFRENFLRVSHLPTILLMIGYAGYWLELYCIRLGKGVTSPSAYGLFLLLAVIAVFVKRNYILRFLKELAGELRKQDRFTRYILFAAFGAAFLIVLIVFLALFQPPHLPQEFDSLNYHLTLPRQHLINSSFKHIRWSSADLFPLTLQFALAPYWLVREIPSKFVQIFFSAGLAAVSLNLARRFGKNPFISVCIAALAILGSHGIGIQMPALMLDLVICYLFIAFLDSFVAGAFFLSAVELAFLSWSRSFYLAQIFFVFFCVFCAYKLLSKLGFKKACYSFNGEAGGFPQRKDLKRTAIIFLTASVILGGPFLGKSLYYAGTPIFPFFTGLINLPRIQKDSPHYESMIAASEDYVAVKDSYGSGRSLPEFVRHLWILAVPEKGVVNRYDYPLGLPYLLFLGPFLYLFVSALRRKEFIILPFFILAYWLTWWFGSQQARFLYIPLVLMFIVVSSAVKRPSRIFMGALAVAVLLNFVSVFRAHYSDLAASPLNVLREKDRNLLAMSKEYFKSGKTGPVILDYFDAAYAQFPVEVRAKDGNKLLPWVLEY